MAILKDKFLRGIIGPIVAREHRGQQVIQKMPKFSEKKLTEGTKNAAKVFGKASKLAVVIRDSLFQATRNFYDGTMIYRLNTEVLRCLTLAKNTETQTFNFKSDHFQSLTGFEFNVNSPVKKLLFAYPVSSIEGNQLTIEIPEISFPTQIKFPADCNLCKLLLVNAQFDLLHGKMNISPIDSMDIAHNHKPISIPPQTFKFNVSPGCLCITAISFQFIEKTFAGDFIINNKSFNPSAILNVYLAEGEPIISDEEKWSEMGFKSS